MQDSTEIERDGERSKVTGVAEEELRLELVGLRTVSWGVSGSGDRLLWL